MPLDLDLLKQKKLPETEWIDCVTDAASTQVRGDFTAEHSGIGAGDKNMTGPTSVDAADEFFPTLYILDFIKKEVATGEILYLRVVPQIGLDNPVEFSGLQIQAFVLKVNKDDPLNPGFFQEFVNELIEQKGFTAAPDSD